MQRPSSFTLSPAAEAEEVLPATALVANRIGDWPPFARRLTLISACFSLAPFINRRGRRIGSGEIDRPAARCLHCVSVRARPSHCWRAGEKKQ